MSEFSCPHILIASPQSGPSLRVGSTAPQDMFLDNFASQPDEEASLGGSYAPETRTYALSSNMQTNSALNQLTMNMFPEGMDSFS